ncbi:40084_t:CDS:2, partial [Gigaspora margarita]
YLEPEYFVVVHYYIRYVDWSKYIICGQNRLGWVNSNISEVEEEASYSNYI